MPRPDKRFVRHPRRGASESSTTGDASTPQAPSRRFVKGRHMAAPGAAGPLPDADHVAPSALPPHSLPDERVSKYDRRSSGASDPVPTRNAPPKEPAAAPALEAGATEVVVDLRENATGFQAVYWRRPAGRVDDQDD